jgi:hypothetical protein
VSHQATRWWHAHAREFVDFRTEPVLNQLGWILADYASFDADSPLFACAWPSQETLVKELVLQL